MKDTIPFWNWFKANHERYKNIHAHGMDTINQLLDELITELKKYSEGLFVEIGGRAEPYELIITPQGMRDYFADAEWLVLNSLPVDGWQYFALKPPHGMSFDFRMGDMELKPASIFFKPFVDEEDEESIGICVLHKDFQEEDEERRNALINGLYHCLDSVLGEYSVTLDINFLEFDKLPDGGETQEGILSISELVNYISWRKKERKMYEVRQPGDETSLLQGTRDNKPVFILVNRLFKHYNYKPEYPFLLTTQIQFNETRQDGLPEDSMEDIYSIEDYIVTTIGENGHHIVSETYDGIRTVYCYIDTLENAQRIRAAIYDGISSHKLNAEIAYDKYWVEVMGYM